MGPWYPSGDGNQPLGGRPAVRYEPRECRLRHMRVWAILTRASGDWAVVNCLDKEPACASCRCALVCQDGAWPFEEPVDHSET